MNSLTPYIEPWHVYPIVPAQVPSGLMSTPPGVGIGVGGSIELGVSIGVDVGIGSGTKGDDEDEAEHVPNAG